MGGERDSVDGTLSGDVRSRHSLFFSGSTHSSAEHSIVCCQIGQTCPPHKSEHSRSPGGPMNLLPLQDWSSLNKLSGDVGLWGFTRVALFGFGGG